MKFSARSTLIVLAVGLAGSGLIAGTDLPWSFRALPKQVPIPEGRGLHDLSNPIDRFIVAALREKGLKPADRAAPEHLIRRVHLDLIGLPPTPAQVEAFVRDPSVSAYEKIVDDLLASPRYGERWAQHWLDVVRYSDSDGYRIDDYRPQAWRYRDWVIRSLNADMPYDQFLSWQLAGDELAPDEPDALTATGYLRLWPYEYNQRDVNRQWREILDDITDVLGDSVLGLSLSCAKCHDHKFDPISQRDYYSLRSYFAAILPDDSLVAATARQKAEYQAQLSKWLEATAALREQSEKITAPVRQRLEKGAINKFHDEYRAILATPFDDLSPGQKQIHDLAYRQLLYEHPKIAGQLKGDDRKKWEQIQQELKTFDDLKPADLPSILAVRDVGPQAPANTLPNSSRDIAPAGLSRLEAIPAADRDPAAPAGSTGRRTALARWLTQPDHPLTARVMVNRLWQHHFGQGLVPTSNDFGRQGTPPTHPALLDWLARTFVSEGWSLKKMHRLMVTSRTYCQTSLREPDAITLKADPANHLLWRYPLKRLDAEQIRDAMLQASGELEERSGGEGVDDRKPVRSIYLRKRRNSLPELLTTFDGPDLFSSCARRNDTITAPQALLLLNSPWTIQRGKALAGRVRQVSTDPREQVRQAWLLTTSRSPDSGELSDALHFLQGPALEPAEPRPHALPTGWGRGVELGRQGPAVPLELADDPRLPGGDFTAEAVIRLDSLYEDAAVRTILSQWTGSQKDSGWSLGVTSRKSRYQPGNLILQLTRAADDQGRGGDHEVIASNLHIDLNRFYHVAVSVRIAETGETGIRFFAQALEGPDQTMKTAAVSHRITSGHRGGQALVIGGRARTENHAWKGVIGSVRLSDRALQASELLSGPSAETFTPVAWWKFEESNLLGDSSGNGLDLKRRRVAPPQSAQLLEDFCHVLLNSNAFLHVD